MPAPPPPERLAQDLLFLACTRPAMVAGVPMEAMGLNVILTGAVFLTGGSLLYLTIAPALHLLFAGLCRADHNAFRVLLVYLDTKARARNRRLWGGSSWTPLPLRRARRAEELRYG